MDRIVNDKYMVPSKNVNVALAPARVARAEEALTSVKTKYIVQTATVSAGANANESDRITR